jgi:hypothetical protein
VRKKSGKYGEKAGGNISLSFPVPVPGLRIELTKLKCEFFNGFSLFRIAVNVARILPD